MDDEMDDQMDDEIEFNVQTWVPAELDYVRDSLTRGQQSANGAYSRRVRRLLQAETEAAEVLLTTSCTAALELSAMLLDIQPGDIVIVPSFSFTTTALAFVRQGARLLFGDIESRTLGLDPAHVAELLADPVHGPRVRAVVLVHYAGIACDVAGIRAALAERPDIAVIEDNAHGLFGRWGGEPLGSLGRFSTLSFHETKNISCGEGGALVLNDPADVARSWVHYDKGTDRQAFLQGQVDKYSWRDTGSSFGLADPLAAILLAQLEEHEVIQGRRRGVFERYLSGLTEHADELGIEVPDVPDDREPAYHLFHVLLPEPERRGEVIAAMRAKGVPTAFHYVPLHDSDGGRRFAAAPGECPTSTEVSARLLRLPFHQELEASDCDRVVTALVDVLSGR